MLEISRRYVQSYGVPSQPIQLYVSQSLPQMEHYVAIKRYVIDTQYIFVLFVYFSLIIVGDTLIKYLTTHNSWSCQFS